MAKKSAGVRTGSRARAKAKAVNREAARSEPAPTERSTARSAPLPTEATHDSGPAQDTPTLRTGPDAVHLTPQGLVEGRSLTLAQVAMQWTYVVRNRRRWSTSPDLKKQQAADAAKLLKGFGVSVAHLEKFAHAKMVEVSIPWCENEAENWPARILPWEYIIAASTRDWRSDKPLTVVRHMDYRGDARPRKKNANQCVLFVVSEPGPLEDLYQFDTERALLRKVADDNGTKNWKELHNPTEQELVDKLHEWQPDVVHFTGFDTHQAVSELAQIEKDQGRPFDVLWDRDPTKDDSNPPKDVPAKDGYVLKGTTRLLNAVDAERLADILRNSRSDADNADSRPPRLVVFNFYNSAARVASLAVSRGVESAVGFQDQFDDDLAERFLHFFYTGLDWSDANSAIAFSSAFERVRTQPQHHQGSGVVHWSTAPLLTSKADLEAVNRRLAGIDKTTSEEPKLLLSDSVSAGEIDKLIKVTVNQVEDINYSTLHNNRELFDKFTIALIGSAKGRGKRQFIRDVAVTVSLDVGNGIATYQQTLEVEYPFRDLSADIHLPLTSTLTRAVHESINTSMLVDIRWGAHVLYRNSLRVRLTPVDQWRDSDSDRRWLPSFVFPRDPAVAELVDRAQRYVRVLRDDPASGFDGYQSVNPTQPVSTEEVDLQVQAIWSTIVHEMELTYINPPPGYSSTLDSQRLRTPSMVRDYRSGTCIDLALLFAACLELIDVYPVIFLLQGHAYPGYWRWDAYHEEFLRTKFDHIPATQAGTSEDTQGAEVQEDTWFFKQDTRREIVRYIQEGKLVPLETVRVTENCGFWEAVEAGTENFADPAEFEAMVDIKLARDLLVTPLPILGEEG